MSFVGLWLLVAFGFCWLLVVSVDFWWLRLALARLWLLASDGFWLLVASVAFGGFGCFWWLVLAFGFCWLLVVSVDFWWLRLALARLWLLASDGFWLLVASVAFGGFGCFWWLVLAFDFC